MPGPKVTSADVTVGDGELSFEITAYESSSVYIKADVFKPSISLFNESTGTNSITPLETDVSNQIVNPVVITGLTNNVEYMWDVITHSGKDASGHKVGTATPLGAPGQAVLGNASYQSDGGVKVPVTIDLNGTTILKYKVQVYNVATNKTQTKYISVSSTGDDWNTLQAGYINITYSDWSSLESTSQNFTIFVQAAPSSHLYSDVASRQYSLLPTPAAPDAFSMDDSAVLGEGLIANVTVPTYTRLTGANFFIDVDACGNDANTWNNVASQLISHGKTTYEFPVSAIAGLLQTYKVRVREVLASGTILYSPYFSDSESIMNEYYQAGTLVAEQLTNSGSNARFPAATFDYFKLSYAGGESTFGSRHIVSTSIEVSGSDINGTVDVSGVTPTADANGNHAIPASGNLDLYCFVKHMQLDNSLDDNRTFSIAADGVQGYYSAAQQRAGAEATAQDINSAIIKSNTIIERAPLEKPAPVSSVDVAGENQQLAATWIVDVPGTGENKTATSFDVSLYLTNNTGVAIETINTTNQHYTFTVLTNDVSYKVGVKAKNGSGSAAEVMSGTGTPTKNVLPNDTIINIELYDVPNSGDNHGTKVNMTCEVVKPTGYRIDTIEIQSINAYGTTSTSNILDISAANTNTGFAGPVNKKLVEDISDENYSGIHRYRFRAVSNEAAVNNAHGSVAHIQLKSEWEYAQINLTQKPKITAFTYNMKDATKWAGKTTDIVVKALARGLDIEAATTNVIAIPEPTAGTNMDIVNMVHQLENPVYTASDSTYTYKLTLNYHLLDMDSSGATQKDVVAVALVTNADGQAIDSQPTDVSA